MTGSRFFAVAAIVMTLATSASADAEKRAEDRDRGPGASDHPGSKKHRWLLEKQTRQGQVGDKERRLLERSMRRRIGRKPTTPISVFNLWTHETLVANHESRRGGLRRARQRVLATQGTAGVAIEWHLRCHFTNEPTTMDARLFQVIVEAATHFQVSRVEVISGFRAAKYNLQLRKKGRQVARTSHHTRGEAVDFRLPGVPTSRLRAWARRLRLGGVGYYPHSRFIHVDIGKVRSWRGH